MTTITVQRTLRVAPEVVWAELRHIERHVEWMNDAVATEFTSDQREGVGTEFYCDTKVGPLRTRDVMTVTEWADDSAMGVTHRGLVTGVGRFTLERCPAGTIVTWSESLHFPWWFGGPLGAIVASPVLRALWTKNLRQLGERLA